MLDPSPVLATHPAFTYAQKALLRKGRILTVSDLVLTPAEEIARRCRVALSEIQPLVELACRGQPIQARTLEDIFGPSDDEDDQITRQLRLTGEKFTTGDEILDAALGGGLQTGMVWEIVGESSAGKTQLALQLSLAVQLPRSQGGLEGSTCYLTTSRQLETQRLKEIATAHPIFSELSSGQLFDNVHTLRVPAISSLENILSTILPNFVETRLKDGKGEPVRLLIIDALGELFHLTNQTTTNTLVERSHNITTISTLLHELASRYGLAIVVLNEVVDAFHTDIYETEEDDHFEGLLYASHSRWFNRAHSLPGEDRKEASLGLVWANQVNTRIMLSRTGRRRYLDSLPAPGDKRQRINSASGSLSSSSNTTSQGERGDENDNSTLIRRLTVIFSSVAPPTSVDYIVTTGGISVLPDSEPSISSTLIPAYSTPAPAPAASSISNQLPSASSHAAHAQTTPPPPSTQLAPLDIGFVEDNESPFNSSGSKGFDSDPTTLYEDEWEKYWEMDEITEEMYLSVAATDSSDGVSVGVDGDPRSEAGRVGIGIEGRSADEGTDHHSQL
ncbi:hypothetical protein D9758_003925 [Tetrapyrgos nigripes]|uniref:RecA family profile 1 domain-containing protein n=1 Tax=Tetrapyrgos nigripes TaxID=182062 RepID=A0A8H5GLG2_9AGAR|nr:hypothetical protein D9758_003925 [Tetrapyrgos nigripes]